MTSVVFTSQVLAQAGDSENYKVLNAWIYKNLRKEIDGVIWTAEGDEWAIGNTANYALGVAMVRHPGWYRAFHRGQMISRQ